MEGRGVVAVFGGSFSPVHTGHMEVARTIISRGLADEVWLMPCKRNPLKDGMALLPDEERVRLLKRAVKWYDENDASGDSGLWVNLKELEMPSPSYTIDTMKALGREMGIKQLRLVVGADSYLDFTRWKDWKKLEKYYNPIVYPRPGYEIEELRPGWTLLEGVRQVDISSTRLREMMATGENTYEYMPWRTGRDD